MKATATTRADGRPRRATGDASGKVRIVVQLVGTRHRFVKGNMTRVMTFTPARVSEVADLISRAVEPLVARGRL